jgi:hypothetical protein
MADGRPKLHLAAINRGAPRAWGTPETQFREEPDPGQNRRHVTGWSQEEDDSKSAAK